MKVDASLATTPLPDIPDAARRIEALGYDGMYSFDSAHDPFLPLLLAGEHTERATLTTAVAIAFARNPMTLAQVSYDLQVASRGRFVLGLGKIPLEHVWNVVEHEPLAVFVLQYPAFAAHPLRDQRSPNARGPHHARRVKLDEFRIHQLRPGP